MNEGEIIGVSLYSNDPDEIIKVIKDNIDTQDEYKIAACAHAIGHLARRFAVDVSKLHNSLMKRAVRFSYSKFAMGAIVDMNADIEQFKRKNK